MSNPDTHIARLLADLDRAWAGGFTAVLFGSLARGEYLPGWSDINVLLVAPALTPEALRHSREALSRWRTEAEALPLLFAEPEWRHGADAYPLEIAEMQTAYRVLRGPDPLEGMQVRPADLRASLEREFRGKLMRLRQGYALFSPDSEELREFVRSSASSVLLLCRGMLVLAGEPIPPASEAVLTRAGQLAGFAPEPLSRIIAGRGDSAWRVMEPDVQAYLAAVESAARWVDHFQTGART